MKPTLWNRDFTLLTVATVMGAVGGVASSFALSFLIFDETGSTLASALLLAAQILPNFVLPLVASPWLDRLPRKPCLVGGRCDQRSALRTDGTLVAAQALFLHGLSVFFPGAGLLELL